LENTALRGTLWAGGGQTPLPPSPVTLRPLVPPLGAKQRDAGRYFKDRPELPSWLRPASRSVNRHPNFSSEMQPQPENRKFLLARKLRPTLPHFTHALYGG
jgi:hypothetical protein